jgi:hypothetical protein
LRSRHQHEHQHQRQSRLPRPQQHPKSLENRCVVFVCVCICMHVCVTDCLPLCVCVQAHKKPRGCRRRRKKQAASKDNGLPVTEPKLIALGHVRSELRNVISRAEATAARLSGLIYLGITGDLGRAQEIRDKRTCTEVLMDAIEETHSTRPQPRSRPGSQRKKRGRRPSAAAALVR